jgi:dihydrofolate reductase
VSQKRRIVMFNRIGPDGQFAAAGGAVDWFVPDPEIDAVGARACETTDTFLFGRKTYDVFAQFWPYALRESATAPHGGGPLHAAQRALARALNERTKLVWSTTLERASWANTRILRRFDAREIAAWKAQPGLDMVVLGSGSLVSQLTEQRLIDEYSFVVSPLLLGHGQALLRGLPQRVRLELLDVSRYASGNVLLRYGLAR